MIAASIFTSSALPTVLKTMADPKTSPRAGFSVLELLIVVAVIGIVAAFVVANLDDTKENAYIGAMKNDLRNVVPAQEIFQTENASYASTPSELGMSTTEDVSLGFGAVTTERFVAVTSHVKTDRRCQVSRNADLVTDRRVLCQLDGLLPERARVTAEIDPFLAVSSSETFTFTGERLSLGDTPIKSWEWKVWDIDPQSGSKNCTPTDPTKSLVASGTGQTFSVTLDAPNRQYWTGLFAHQTNGETSCFGVGGPVFD